MKKKTRSAPHSFLRRVCMIVIGPLANFKAVTGPPTQEVPAEDDGLTGVAGGSPSLGPLSTGSFNRGDSGASSNRLFLSKQLIVDNRQ